MPAVAFCPQSEFTALVLGECLEESLHEFPDEWCSGDSGGGLVVTEAEPGTDRLIHIEHIGVRVPRMWIQAWLITAINKVAWPVFLEQPDH